MTTSNEQSLFSGLALYPHFKLTRERFPRLLATRRAADDGAEYFGPFLPVTGVRFLLDFLNRIFSPAHLRLALDGRFDVPCTQYYRRRCLAPCVRSLCGEAEYLARVELVRLFLRRETAALERGFRALIERAAAALDFELAAAHRDAWLEIEKALTAKDWNFRLDDAVDTFEAEPGDAPTRVYLVTMRGRKTLGRRVFAFDEPIPAAALWPALMRAFYRFHLPREIRVAGDFPGRRALAAELGARHSRPLKISVARPDSPRVMTARALGRARYEDEFRRIRRVTGVAEIRSELRAMFALPDAVSRIEAFDVAHIAGRDFVAAKTVWENGLIVGREDEFWFSDAASELETLKNFIARRFARAAPDFAALLLIDGGRAHLRAALKALENPARRRLAVVSAVKPPGRHGEIAYFLDASETRLEFDGRSAAHRLLQTMRDEAHALSNDIHRQRREMAHHYELAALLPALDESARRGLLKKAGSLKKLGEMTDGELAGELPPAAAAAAARDLARHRRGNSPPVEPLIVPLRYADENGDAQDLRPLASYRIK